MAGIPSMGDVLLLSHTAKGIGKAFGVKAPGVPQDFFEVDRETQGLADALKLLAYTLEEDSLVTRASKGVQEGIYTILSSAQITLKDLATFVERYSVHGRTGTNSASSGEKAWSRTVLRDWQTLPWTRDKGDITALRSLLMMHCSTVNMITQALQSHSLPRLEKTVVPLAAKLEDIHDDIPGRLSKQLEELHQITMDILIASRATALLQSVEQVSPCVQDFDIHTPTPMHPTMPPNFLGALSFEGLDNPIFPEASSQKQPSHSRTESLTQLFVEKDSTGWKVRKRAPSQASDSDDEMITRPRSPPAETSPPRSKRSKSADQSTRPFPSARSVGDNRHSAYEVGGEVAGPDLSSYPVTPRRLQKRQVAPQRKSMPAPETIGFASPITPSSRQDLRAFTSRSTGNIPRSSFSDNDRVPSNLPTPPRSRSGTTTPHEGNTLNTPFVESLLNDSIKIFDDRCKLVEALSYEPQQTSRRRNSVNTIICKTCRILIVKKRTETRSGAMEWTTSVWILAWDSSVRLEQPLPFSFEAHSIAPHVSFTSPEKVVLTIPTKIQYHPPIWGCFTDAPGTTLPAERITYTFASPQTAAKFQSAVFGHRLLDSFRVDRATVVRPGGSSKHFLRSIFGSEEEMCGQQRLRLWTADGDATPSSPAGGVLALMHLRPAYGEGWVQWWVNSKRPVRIKSKSRAIVEIRGLDCMVSKPASRPIYGTDSFSQASLVARTPPEDEAYMARISMDRPGSSHNTIPKTTLSRTPSMSTMKSGHTTRSTNTTHTMHSFRSFRTMPFSLRGRRSRSRSRSETPSQAHSRSNSAAPTSIDLDEPLPSRPIAIQQPTINTAVSPFQDSVTSTSSYSLGHISSQAISTVSTRSDKDTASSITPRSSSSMPSSASATKSLPPIPIPRSTPLLPPTTPGKWDNPISPRVPKDAPRKSTDAPRASSLSRASFLDSDPATSTHQSRLDAHAAPKTPMTPQHPGARDFDSMSFVSTHSRATTVKSSKGGKGSKGKNEIAVPTIKTPVREKGGRQAQVGKEKGRKKDSGRGKKTVHGVKIYFSSEEDKERFLKAVGRARERLLALPEV